MTVIPLNKTGILRFPPQLFTPVSRKQPYPTTSSHFDGCFIIKLKSIAFSEPFEFTFAYISRSTVLRWNNNSVRNSFGSLLFLSCYNKIHRRLYNSVFIDTTGIGGELHNSVYKELSKDNRISECGRLVKFPLKEWPGLYFKFVLVIYGNTYCQTGHYIGTSMS